MKKLFSVILISFMTLGLHAQLGSQANKLVGEWSYKHSDGFEVWSMVNGDLIGNAFRVNKMGDTSRVEGLSIRRVQKKLAYSTTTYNMIGDSLQSEKHFFLGGKRKLSFENIEIGIPHSITYKFGFFNRNKLKIQVQFHSGQKAKPIILYRQN